MICIMGMDDGHGYDGQQKDTICDIWRTWAVPLDLKFTDASFKFNRFIVFTSFSGAYILRSVDFCGQQRLQNQLLYPLHMHVG